MEDKIKELLLKGWYHKDWNQSFLDVCVHSIKEMIENKRDSFSIALYLYTDWKMNVKYELVKGLEQIKQQFKQQ